MESKSSNTLNVVGKSLIEASAAMNGNTIEAAAPEQNMATCLPRLTEWSDACSTCKVKTIDFEAIALNTGAFTL
jgi:hypothetical protein